jgi:hypothetical protein
MNIIVTMDGSVLFDVGYHFWIISAREKRIMLCGGGLDDGHADLLSSY